MNTAELDIVTSAVRVAIAPLLERLESMERLLLSVTPKTDAAPETKTISLKREGDSLWHFLDPQNPDIHHPVPFNRLLCQFVKLEVVTGEWKGEPTRTAILHVKGEVDTYRIRISAMLTPSKSVSCKFFLDQLQHVPDAALKGNLILEVYPGRDVHTVGVRIVDPETGRDFVPPLPQDPEARENARAVAGERWRDQAYQEQLLELAMSRINGEAPAAAPALDPEPESRVIKQDGKVYLDLSSAPEPTPQPEPEPEPEPTPAPGNFGGEIVFIDTLAGHKTASGTPRKVIRFDVQDHRGRHICGAWDSVAVDLAQNFKVGDRIQMKGRWKSNPAGEPRWVAEEIERWEEVISDRSHLIASCRIYEEQLGWGKPERRKRINARYEVPDSDRLDDAQLLDYADWLAKMVREFEEDMVGQA